MLEAATTPVHDIAAQSLRAMARARTPHEERATGDHYLGGVETHPEATPLERMLAGTALRATRQLTDTAAVTALAAASHAIASGLHGGAVAVLCNLGLALQGAPASEARTAGDGVLAAAGQQGSRVEALVARAAASAARAAIYAPAAVGLQQSAFALLLRGVAEDAPEAALSRLAQDAVLETTGMDALLGSIEADGDDESARSAAMAARKIAPALEDDEAVEMRMDTFGAILRGRPAVPAASYVADGVRHELQAVVSLPPFEGDVTSYAGALDEAVRRNREVQADCARHGAKAASATWEAAELVVRMARERRAMLGTGREAGSVEMGHSHVVVGGLRVPRNVAM